MRGAQLVVYGGAKGLGPGALRFGTMPARLRVQQRRSAWQQRSFRNEKSEVDWVDDRNFGFSDGGGSAAEQPATKQFFLSGHAGGQDDHFGELPAPARVDHDRFSRDAAAAVGEGRREGGQQEGLDRDQREFQKSAAGAGVWQRISDVRAVGHHSGRKAEQPGRAGNQRQQKQLDGDDQSAIVWDDRDGGAVFRGERAQRRGGAGERAARGYGGHVGAGDGELRTAEARTIYVRHGEGAGTDHRNVAEDSIGSVRGAERGGDRAGGGSRHAVAGRVPEGGVVVE